MGSYGTIPSMYIIYIYIYISSKYYLSSTRNRTLDMIYLDGQWNYCNELVDGVVSHCIPTYHPVTNQSTNLMAHLSMCWAYSIDISVKSGLYN